MVQLCLWPVDFRKGMRASSVLVYQGLGAERFGETFHLLINRRRTALQRAGLKRAIS